LESNDHPSGQERNIEYQESKLKGNRPKTRDLIIYVIGIDNYENWPKLRNAVKDATGLLEVLLKKFGFIAPILPLLNEKATKEKILEQVRDDLRGSLKKEDSLVVFFAGHGHTSIEHVGDRIIETGYLIPVGAKSALGQEEQFSDYIEVDQFLQTIAKLPARHILVILDSCYSGFALGEAMKTYRSGINRYIDDLKGRVSRKVITSARREQPALDGGPIEGHSLFTGTLIDGLNWAKADLDHNDLITSSELGLFLQQQVGNSSDSRQTPDFGSFHYDNRGELALSLRDETFDKIKARAFTSLRSGNLRLFEELVKKIEVMRPGSPESLYLQYRLLLFQRRVDDSYSLLQKLRISNISLGTIPISPRELEYNSIKLRFWRKLLSFEDRVYPPISHEFPFSIQVLRRVYSESSEEGRHIKDEPKRDIGTTDKMFREELVTVKKSDAVDTFQVEQGDVIQLSIKNTTRNKSFLYMIDIDINGNIEPTRLWEDEEILFSGVSAGDTRRTFPFKMSGEGLCELRLFSSPMTINYLLSPPPIKTRGAMPDRIEEVVNLDLIGVKTMHYLVKPRSSIYQL
jgi:hypothetical protein